MSPAPEKRYKVRFPGWAYCLDDVPLNAALPRTAGSFQRQTTNVQRQIFFIIKGAKDSHRDPRESNKRGGDVFRGPGYGAMARALNVDRKTVYRNVKALMEKGFLISFERFGERGQRAGTWYSIPPWKDALAANAENPRFAKATVNGKTRIVVIGRARRFMLTEETGDGFLVARDPKSRRLWKLMLAQVPESAELPDADEETIDVPELVPDVDAPPEIAAAAEPNAVELILAALNEWCTTGAGIQDAERVISKAQAHARVITRERATPTPLEMAAMVRQIGAEHIHRRKRSPGFMLGLLEGKVHTWNNARLLEIARRTQAEARAAQNPLRSVEELERELDTLRQDDAVRKRGAG